ncbi:MAG: hypothetical protein ACRELC_05685, partial [Gemmatimonadota bacterium]
MHARRLSLHAFVTSRGARSIGVLAAGLAAGVVLFAAGAGVASTPPASTVTVPTAAGQTVSSTWTGTILAGANPTSACAPVSSSLVDEHAVTVNVASGTYESVDASFRFTIEWEDAANDEILTVVDPEGEVVDSSDGGSNVETVNANNLPAGTYKAVA